MKTDYEFCIIKEEKKINNIEDLIEFEKKLYSSFKNDSPDGWLIKNYRLIENNRLQPSIPYDDVTIYMMKKKSSKEIIAGISGHINMKNQLQLEQMGFKINKENKICEGLNFYISNEIGDSLFFILGTFLEKIIEQLKTKKIHMIYSTCSPHLKNMYSLFGFDMLDSIYLEGKEETLIRLLI